MADEPNDDYMDLDEGAAALDAMEGLQPDTGSDIPDAQDEAEAPEGEEAEAQEDGEDEPAKPAIDTPASLNAEERARFAQLQPEAQRMLADVETRRARQVTEVTTNAANAQRQAKADAAQAAVQAKQVYAEQLHTFVSAYAPQRPNPANYSDMQQFSRDDAQFQYAAAQHQQLMQQVQGIGAEAQSDQGQLRAAVLQQEMQKAKAALPDLADPEKGPKLVADLKAIAAEYGYGADRFDNADADDFVALNKMLRDRKDADKYRAIVGKKMADVRAQRKTTTPGVAQPRQEQRTQAAKTATARLAKTGSVDDAAAAIAALGR